MERVNRNIYIFYYKLVITPIQVSLQFHRLSFSSDVLLIIRLIIMDYCGLGFVFRTVEETIHCCTNCFLVC